MNTNPILIFGMDRSGTSLVGNLVSRWGAYGGKTLMTLGDTHNPRGYYENVELADFVADHLGEVFQPDYEQVLAEKTNSPVVRRAFERFVGKMRATQKVWFVKEPLLGVMLPFFRSFFDDPVCVITVRNPYESALSWQKFVMPKNSEYQILSANLLRWQYLISSTLRNVQGRRKVFLSFEALHEDPESSVRKLAAFLDACYGRRSDEAVISHMLAAVDKKLYRNKSETDFLEYPGASEDQKKLYGILRGALDNPDKPIDLGGLTLPLGWSEYVRNATELGFLAHEAQRGVGKRLLGVVIAPFAFVLFWLFRRFALVRTITGKVHKAFAQTA